MKSEPLFKTDERGSAVPPLLIEEKKYAREE